MSKPKKLTRPQIIAALQRELASEREETKFLRATIREIKECLEDKSIKKLAGDLPCEEYDPAGTGAGVEEDGYPQCANCGHPKTAHA